MLAILAILPTIVALWAVVWLCGVFGVRLPKKSWKRLAIAVISIPTIFGILVLQVYLLTTLKSGKFARDVFVYIVVAECVPGIVLGFFAAVREGRAKKRRLGSG